MSPNATAVQQAADLPVAGASPRKKDAAQEELKAQLRIDKLRTKIPKECFEKSLPASLFYMARDFGLLGLGWYVYPLYVQGSIPLTFLWWNYMGFFMWALFVVGHDCGHTTFSNSSTVNAVCGHICHAAICVPFWPWAKSHHQHHMFHNHVEKDMSFPWFDKKQYEKEVGPVGRFILSTPVHPFFSYSISYLFLGYWDGSHFNPLETALFWNRREQIQAAVSVASVAAFLYLLVDVIFAHDYLQIFMRYTVPWAIYNYWLVMVTYMQHHEPDTKTFDDSNYHFAVAAMETVDRSYCWGIDGMHHNITDGHVVHHLFFTKIPHYNLAKATKALTPYLRELGVYRQHTNPNFLWDFIRYNYQLGLFTSTPHAHSHSGDAAHQWTRSSNRKEQKEQSSRKSTQRPGDAEAAPEVRKQHRERICTKGL